MTPPYSFNPEIELFSICVFWFGVPCTYSKKNME